LELELFSVLRGWGLGVGKVLEGWLLRLAAHCSQVASWGEGAETGKMDGCNGCEDMPKKHGQPEARQQEGGRFFHPLSLSREAKT